MTKTPNTHPAAPSMVRGNDVSFVTLPHVIVDGARMDADEEKKEEKKDSNNDDISKKLDALLSACDSLRSDVASCTSRMDAWDEEKKADAARRDAAKKDDDDAMMDKKDAAKKDEEGDAPKEIVEGAKRLAADRRKDADDKEEKDKDEEKKDSARADAVGELQKMVKDQAALIASISAKLPKDTSDAEYSTLIGCQARADEVYSIHGERAPRPLQHENPSTYRRRVVNALKKHSDRWKTADIDAIRDDSTFETIESQVYADATARGLTPNDIAKGRIRERSRTLPSGHMITEFFGNDTHFTGSAPFTRGVPRVESIYTGR